MYLRMIFFLLRERLSLLFQPQRTGQHWCRVAMDQATKAMIVNLDHSAYRVLEISGSKWKDFPFRSYQQVSFPDFDICSQRLDEQFDLIIAEQVFEHLKFPYRGAKNIFEMLRPGGFFLITTPFLIKVHPDPIDCSRWTEQGIKYFLSEAGFPIEYIQSGSWGNLECLLSNYNRWTVFDPKTHSLENDPLVPLVVWALAKK